MENFGKFCLFILLMFLAATLSGLVISKLWLWFVVPTFGLVPITIVQSIGLSLLVGIFKGVKSSGKDDSFKEIVEKSLTGMITILMLFGIGWIVSLFM